MSPAARHMLCIGYRCCSLVAHVCLDSLSQYGCLHPARQFTVGHLHYCHVLCRINKLVCNHCMVTLSQCMHGCAWQDGAPHRLWLCAQLRHSVSFLTRELVSAATSQCISSCCLLFQVVYYVLALCCRSRLSLCCPHSSSPILPFDAQFYCSI